MRLADQPLSTHSRQLLTRTEIDPLLADLPAWQLVEIDDVPRLTKSYAFSNFAEALAFTTQVGQLAEAENHHPALLTEWGKVTVSWWTHSLGGVQRNDLIMASRTDRLLETAGH
ncbi:pterin-4-alpha-carbinolamine dehydratase [Halopseudomonas xinjiangensis]|uniref:Putative pterin-4-alpha-carbinolamine dehydratase n=1 Tax=Halopseudomonas xinjiangensis TaxID=487184 RepID=A0A1H1TUD2_9GAMM|nr:4a-hydroxytetrahydrobiopterin dehydratase [Halopseudomonas xinjiangensis]SDS63800.1 pterin-4-alpha-carbinolamine dehydratase [Halopseudomonas xinjiangensis]